MSTPRPPKENKLTKELNPFLGSATSVHPCCDILLRRCCNEPRPRHRTYHVSRVCRSTRARVKNREEIAMSLSFKPEVIGGEGGRLWGRGGVRRNFWVFPCLQTGTGQAVAETVLKLVRGKQLGGNIIGMAFGHDSGQHGGGSRSVYQD
ncbi:hypothetical protein GWK47_054292 [Chionoecetes opilio]|uniref:Uncharacterized protein n=1 Tax=Chionoecetes opilio TaxID=41210 RepID=A0A8J4Y681_CHIOP|nr:hypothetical protein GWK47_054292 [Chionoecetes opilio]